VLRLTVTITAPMEDVTCPTITAAISNTRPKNATSTHLVLMTAVHADCLMVSSTRVGVTTKPKTVRSHCSSPVMANATKIRLQKQRQPFALPHQVTLSTMKVRTCVISRPVHVLRDIFMPTVSVTSTGQEYTPLTRVKTLADITPMADAIITRVTVHRTTIRLMLNAIVIRVILPGQHAKISADSMRRPHQTQVESVTTILLTVLLDSPLIHATAS